MGLSKNYLLAHLTEKLRRAQLQAQLDPEVQEIEHHQYTRHQGKLFTCDLHNILPNKHHHLPILQKLRLREVNDFPKINAMSKW